MILRVEDFADEVFEEFKDKIPGLTKRKVELLLKNSFFCVSWHISRINPIQFGDLGMHPNAYYAAYITNDIWIVPQKNFSKIKKLNAKIAKANQKLKNFAR